MIQYIAIVLAAGQGKRMKAGENKQFITLEGQPLIIHTLQVFAEDEWCKSIVLVVNGLEKQRIEQLVHDFALKKPVHIVEGGVERQDSVYKGLCFIDDPDSIIFIHDGARPFVTRHHLHQLAEVTEKEQAALLAVPVTDTIKEKNGEHLTTLDRSTLWAAQTPQAFRYERIYKAHKMALENGFIGTDDASLVEKLGFPVQIVEGSYQNIKLTTPEDIERAQSILKSGIKEM